MDRLKHFKFWCYKVLPLVYDDSLSYYEVLAKVVAKLNETITSLNTTNETIESIQTALQELQDTIDSYGEDYVLKWLQENLSQMIYVYINDDGYFVYAIPESWNDITFNTTGLDITDEELSESGNVGNYAYGRLVLSVDIPSSEVTG